MQFEGLSSEVEVENPKMKATKSTKKASSKTSKLEKSSSDENSEFMIQPVKSGKKKAGK